MTTATEHRRAVVAWLLVCFFWSTTYLAIRIGVASLPPIGMVSGARFLTAGVIMCAILLARGVPLPERESWPAHLVIGALMMGVGNGGLVWAEQWVPSGIAAVMQAAVPFWMIGVEAALPSGERIRPVQLLGLLLGFGGLVLLAASNLQLTQSDRHFVQGAIGLQLSCCGWAIGSAYSKRHARHQSSFGAAGLQMLFGGGLLTLAGLLLGEFHDLHFTRAAVLAWAYLVVFGALVGYASFLYALKYLPVARVSLYAYITPILAVILGSLVLHEPVTGRMALAIAITFSGMLIVRRNADTLRN